MPQPEKEAAKEKLVYLYRRTDLPLIMFPYTEKQASDLVKQGVPLVKAEDE